MMVLSVLYAANSHTFSAVYIENQGYILSRPGILLKLSIPMLFALSLYE